jgi:general secretion pathway protein A
MYEAFYGLRERPFELTANPKYLLLTAKHREALASLRYGMSGHQGITLLLGEAGTGKTSLVTAALAGERDRRSKIAHLANPSLTREEFFDLLATAFELSSVAAASKSRFLIELQELLVARRARSEPSVLVVDEAQSLSDLLLEEIRLLANLETATEKLLPVILAGQPELGARLNEPHLRQLKQRIALRCHLTPLEGQETGAYIATRIARAGGDPAQVFTREAVAAIAGMSGGIPRTINVICDNAMLSGFALNRRPIATDLVEEVCRDFDIGVAEPARRFLRPDSQAVASSVPTVSQPEPAKRASQTRPLFAQFSIRRRFSFF